MRVKFLPLKYYFPINLVNHICHLILLETFNMSKTSTATTYNFHNSKKNEKGPPHNK